MVPAAAAAASRLMASCHMAALPVGPLGLKPPVEGSTQSRLSEAATAVTELSPAAIAFSPRRLRFCIKEVKDFLTTRSCLTGVEVAQSMTPRSAKIVSHIIDRSSRLTTKEIREFQLMQLEYGVTKPEEKSPYVNQTLLRGT